MNMVEELSFSCSIAFAFIYVLIRSKPAGISIEDYILTLRKSSFHVQHNPELIRIDHGRTWEQLFFLAQQNPQLCYELGARLQHKERGNAGELSKSRTRTTGKRKFLGDEMVSSETSHQSKRQRPSLLPEAVTDSGQVQDEPQNQVRVQILEAQQQLTRVAQRKNPTKYDLAGAISTACSVILQVSQDNQIAESVGTGRSSRISGNPESLQAALQIWRSMIPVLDEHQQLSSEKDFNGQSITHPMSSVVRSFLDDVHRHCIEEAECEYEDSKVARSRKKSTQRQKAFQDKSSVSTGCLTQIIPTLKNLQTTHGETFEIITRDIVLHIGDVLALHLLESYKPKPTPRTPTPSPSLTESLDYELHIAISAAKLEGPYLIEVLKCLGRTLDLNSGNRYTSAVAERFQKILLQAIMGESRTRRASFSRVYVSGVTSCDTVADVAAQSINETITHDWFLTQIWNILGWAIVLPEHNN